MNLLAAKLWAVVVKEPVLLGSAIYAVFEAAIPDASSAWKLAISTVIAWCVRMASTPEQRAQQRIAEAAELGEEVGAAKQDAALRELARAKRSNRK